MQEQVLTCKSYLGYQNHKLLQIGLILSNLGLFTCKIIPD